MQQLSWCGTNTYPHILMPAALQKIDIDPEQLLYTPKIVDNAAAAVIERCMETSETIYWTRQKQQRHSREPLPLLCRANLAICFRGLVAPKQGSEGGNNSRESAEDSGTQNHRGISHYQQ
ncbi:hypothetical protein LAZ67_12002270 [Cordylochernes scorpioides]|uniref:Uncharacterized protein n=1 Tax=Cordylochernes scorpioides TaxID=51811 RepID=A0ABY6L4F7_9ARAC|nr:hypothetical protein LAZ67_12002270 [Cordylochernes scorpioides]